MYASGCGQPSIIDNNLPCMGPRAVLGSGDCCNKGHRDYMSAAGSTGERGGGGQKRWSDNHMAVSKMVARLPFDSPKKMVRQSYDGPKHDGQTSI
eukprot:jgi/Botrbrau1/8337/Bobra.0081s0025.1